MAVSDVVATCALLVKVRFVLSAPATSGVYVTVNDRLCPAGIIVGTPLSTKRELLELAPVIVTFAPLAVNVPEACPLVPKNTLPMATGDGVTLSVPAVVEPAPLRAIVRVGLAPFEVTVTLPEAAAVDVGAYVTVKLAPCPAASVMGAEIPLSVNPVPLIPTCETVTDVPPVLVSVSESC